MATERKDSHASNPAWGCPGGHLILNLSSDVALRREEALGIAEGFFYRYQ